MYRGGNKKTGCFSFFRFFVFAFVFATAAMTLLVIATAATE